MKIAINFSERASRFQGTYLYLIFIYFILFIFGHPSLSMYCDSVNKSINGLLVKLSKATVSSSRKTHVID